MTRESLSWITSLLHTAGLDTPYGPTKNQFLKKNVRATTILRLLLECSWRGESKSSVYIYVRSIFDLLFFLTCEKTSEQKYTRKIWIRLVKYSFVEVSDPSQMTRFVRELIFNVISKEVKLICARALDNIVLSSTSTSLHSTKHRFFGFFFESLIQRTKITLVLCFRLTKKMILAQKVDFVTKNSWKTPLARRVVKRDHFEVLQKKSSMVIFPCSLGWGFQNLSRI